MILAILLARSSLSLFAELSRQAHEEGDDHPAQSPKSTEKRYPYILLRRISWFAVSTS